MRIREHSRQIAWGHCTLLEDRHKLGKLTRRGRFTAEWPPHSAKPKPREISLLTKQHPDRYSSRNPPSSLEEADARIEELKEDLTRVTSQIENFEERLRHRYEDHQDLKGRKHRASVAMGYMKAELIYLKKWEKAKRQELRLMLLAGDEFNPEDTRSLLRAAWVLMQRLMDDDVEFHDEEEKLFRLIESHLAA